MNDDHRLHVNVPGDLWVKFRAIFPFRGEITAFILRCIQKAVFYNKATLSKDDILEATKEAKDE